MASKKIIFVAWPIGMVCDCIGIMRNGTPKVCHKAIGIVDRFNAFARWRTKQHGRRTCEWLDIVGDLTKG